MFGAVVGIVVMRGLETGLECNRAGRSALEPPAEPQHQPVFRRRIAGHALQACRLHVEPEHQPRTRGLRQAPGVDVLPRRLRQPDPDLWRRRVATSEGRPAIAKQRLEAPPRSPLPRSPQALSLAEIMRNEELVLSVPEAHRDAGCGLDCGGEGVVVR